MNFTVGQAKSNLSHLPKQAAAGEEVIIARGSAPVAQLVSIGKDLKKRQPGSRVGQITYSADVFDPLTDRELKSLGLRS